MISAGIILLLMGFYKDKTKMLGILKQPKDIFSLLLFSLFGLLFCQYSYLTAISYSNAGTATVLQYTAPVMIMLLVCAKARKLPNAKEGLAIVLALIGTFILATHGNVNTMVLTKQGLIWGLFAAIGLVSYTLMPSAIVKKWGSITVTGYGMFIGGVALAFLSKIWSVKVVLDLSASIAIIAICLIGTVLAFTLYLQGVNDIGAVKASMLASIEPVSAAFFAAFWLHTQLVWVDAIGFVCILTTVFLLSKKQRE
jgi:drug/metabolite transporter (DMT)-like permease